MEFGGSREGSGVPLESGALLSALKPFCMLTMVALEEMIASQGNLATAADDGAGAAAGVISAGRRLESSLSSLHSALDGIVSSSPPSPAFHTGNGNNKSNSNINGLRNGGGDGSFGDEDGGIDDERGRKQQSLQLRQAFTPTLPFVMLPLQFVLAPVMRGAPAGEGSDGVGGMGGGGGGRGGRGRIHKAAVTMKMPAGVREKALLCVKAVVQGSGSKFVEGHGVDPTTALLIGLVLTLSECSPTSPSPLPTSKMSMSDGGVVSQRGQSAAVAAIASGRGGSGLSAGTDALRLACLQCLEAILRAPFTPGEQHSNSARHRRGHHHHNNINSDDDEDDRDDGSSPGGWSEVRDVLRTVAKGGVLAQLLQELLQCCQQQGSTTATRNNPGAAVTTTTATGRTMKAASASAAAAAGSTSTTGSDASGGRGGGWGGAEEARAAAGCLDALCSFVGGGTVWRRFLPGIFSGLFRTIRGGVESSGFVHGSSLRTSSISGGAALLPPPPPLLSSIYLDPTTVLAVPGEKGVRGGGNGGGGGGSKSAMAESCLSTLGKVLLMCAIAPGQQRPPDSGHARGVDDLLLPKFSSARQQWKEGVKGGASGMAAAGKEATATATGDQSEGFKLAAGSNTGRTGVASMTTGASAPRGNMINDDIEKTSDIDNPLAVLQQLAATSNARAAGGSDGSEDRSAKGGSTTPPPPPTPAAVAATKVPVAAKLSGPSSGRVRSGDPAGFPKSPALQTRTGGVEVEEGGSALWEAQTSDRLQVLLPPLLAFCRLHPGWRVRRAAAELASSLLAGASGGGSGSKRGGEEGLLGALAPLLVEALVGLLLDGMSRVSEVARAGLDGFRATLSPLRWLEIRGSLMERLCTIVEGLPALAKSADEKRLRAALDLLAGYLSLLRFDARAALDSRLSSILACLSQTLEFDEEFNVQVLEGSYGNSGSRTQEGGRGEGIPGEAFPKYYRRVSVGAGLLFLLHTTPTQLEKALRHCWAKTQVFRETVAEASSELFSPSDKKGEIVVVKKLKQPKKKKKDADKKGEGATERGEGDQEEEDPG